MNKFLEEDILLLMGCTLEQPNIEVLQLIERVQDIEDEENRMNKLRNNSKNVSKNNSKNNSRILNQSKMSNNKNN